MGVVAGKVVGFEVGQGMEIAFDDSGTMTVTKEVPVMVRVENLADMEDFGRPSGGLSCLIRDRDGAS